MRAPWCTVPIRCAGSRVRLPKDSAVRKIMCSIYSSCSGLSDDAAGLVLISPILTWIPGGYPVQRQGTDSRRF